MILNINSFTSQFRISGLASGLDTERIVSDLMRAERLPLDRLKQRVTLAEWKRDDYRDIISSLNSFKNQYLDIINPSTNMLSQASYKKFSTTVTNPIGGVSSVLTAQGTANAVAGNYNIKVQRLATSAVETSSGNVTKTLQSSDIRGALEVTGKKINIAIDGISKEIVFANDYNISDQATGDAFAKDFEDLIINSFGQGIEDSNNPGTYLKKVEVSYDHLSGKLSFSTNTGGGAGKLTLNSANSNDGLAAVGITTGSSNRINVSKSLSDLKDSFALSGGLSFYDDAGTEKIKFSINSKEFEFSASTTLSTLISTINNSSEAGVLIRYDEFSDKFSISSKLTGAGQNIIIDNTWGNFFGSSSVLNIDHSSIGFGATGQDAIVIMNENTMLKSSNNFTENGIQFNLLKAQVDEVQTVKLTSNADEVYNGIVNFINKYNEITTQINTKLSEKYDRNFPPLTDEQKEAMNEKDIEKWEEKAKAGLLRNDPLLSRITESMRRAFFDETDGISKRLFDIGITTGAYSDKGKLIINTNKLKQAIQNDPDSVMNLFSKQSENVPTYGRKLSTAELAMRYNESGVAQRIHDIIQDNISIIRDSAGKKGTLLEKAGMKGDVSDVNNYISNEISRFNKSIHRWMDRLAKKESDYYMKFSRLESAMSKMNSQATWLSNQINAWNN